MKQNTPAWLEWKNQGLGSSDAPIIMGVSPWMTALQLWEIKTGKFKPSQESNWAMERGSRLEPKARAHYQLLTERDMTPALKEHPEYPFLRASLDGFDPLYG